MKDYRAAARVARRSRQQNSQNEVEPPQSVRLTEIGVAALFGGALCRPELP